MPKELVDENAIDLTALGSHYYYGNQTDHRAEFYKAIKSGLPVFVQVIGSHRYNGSIVKVSETLYGSYNSYWYFNRETLTCKWDDRDTGVKLTFKTPGVKVYWLKGYNGDTHYEYTKPEAKEKVVLPAHYDQLGREITVGAPCIYTNYNGVIQLGKVSKISPRNVVYCENFRNESKNWQSEGRIRDPKNNIILLTKDLQDKVMLMKLSVL